MSKLNFQVGDKVIVKVYDMEGVILTVVNEKKKIYHVEITNQNCSHILVVGEEKLQPLN